MSTITIVDPVTRIDGHLKVQVTIDTVSGTQQVTDAQCSGTQFRGFEKILVGRDTKDAPYVTERICGFCPTSHAIASSKAMEAAAGVTIPTNARLIRNLILGADFLQSHIMHFYLLAAPDFVTPPSSAPWTPYWNVDLMRSSTLSQITNNLGTAITMRRKAHEMAAIFAGRMPHLSSIQVGGVTVKPTASMISSFTSYLNTLISFITNHYVPDVKLLASIYTDYKSLGKGPANFLAFGAFETSNAASPTRLFKRGIVYAANNTAVVGVDTSYIKEQVTYSWYDNATNGVTPASGVTTPVDPATKTAAYSWIKAPRYNTKVMEAGPLARMWVNGDYRTGVSVMDRHLARALEAQKIANAMLTWIQQVTEGGSVYTAVTTPYSTSGVGLTEASRGALGHWMTTYSSSTKAANGVSAISRYQMVTPTCWNASPKDSSAVRGAMEQALIGTPVKDTTKPIEVLRVIHSFDPCMACAVHVIRPDGQPVTTLHTPERG